MEFESNKSLIVLVENILDDIYNEIKPQEKEGKDNYSISQFLLKKLFEN